MTSEERTAFLLEYCKDKAPIYNRVSNFIYNTFGLHSAELFLLVTYLLCEFKEIEHGKTDLS